VPEGVELKDEQRRVGSRASLLPGIAPVGMPASIGARWSDSNSWCIDLAGPAPWYSTPVPGAALLRRRLISR
jgi:hypothetical protein